MSNQKNITDFSVENEDMDVLERVEAQYWVNNLEALKRLESNEDFKKVILDGYFKDFAINQTSMLATDYTRKTGTRAEIMERLIAVSNLQDYLITIGQLGTVAPSEDEE